MKDRSITLQKKKSDLKKLVMLMNRQNRRFFPPVRAMLESIDYMLTDEELQLLLRLGTDRYSYEQAAAASGLDAAAFVPIFDSVIRKGYIGIKYYETGEEYYTLHPFIVGWFEAHVPYLIGKPEEKEFSRRWMRFITTFRDYNVFPLRNIMNRMSRNTHISNQSVGTVSVIKNEKGKSVININRSIDVPDSNIYPTSSVIDMLREYGTRSILGQFPCMCRRVTMNIGDPCRLTMPEDGGCIGLGDTIRPYIKYGHARRISLEEAFDIVQRVRDSGAVHTVFHEKDDTRLPQIGMCNCCWDCCEILRSYNIGALPLRYSSFHMAKISAPEKCTGCKKCEKYCPTGAITVTEKKASIDEKKCIGCGQCVHQCASSAVELADNRRTAFLPILKKSEARIKLQN